MQEYIHVKGAREHNLKTSTSRFRATSWWCSPVCPARANRRWRSTPSTPRVSAATLNRCPATRGSSSARWTSRMWIYIDGLSPAISIDQKTTSQNPAFNSRHGHRDLRLYAPAVGAHRHAALSEMRQGDSPADHRPDHRPADGARGKRACSCSRRSSAAKRASTLKVFENARKQGFCPRARGRRDSRPVRKNLSWQRRKKHNIEIVVDRVVIRPDARGRITDSGGDRLGAVRRPLSSRMLSAVNRSRSRRTMPATTAAHFHRRAYPENVLIQQPVWRVPGVHRSGASRSVDPDRVIPNRHLSISRALSARPVGECRHGASRRCTTTHSAKARLYAGNAHRGVLRAGTRRAAVRHRR